MKADPIVCIFKHRLNGESAYMTALVFQQMIDAIWRAYGDQMADFEARVFPDEHSPFGFHCCNHPAHGGAYEDHRDDDYLDDIDDIPF